MSTIFPMIENILSWGMALVNDGSYGPLDVLRACPPLTVVVPLVLFGISIYTTLGAKIGRAHV